jgi:hypothetical protein
MINVLKAIGESRVVDPLAVRFYTCRKLSSRCLGKVFAFGIAHFCAGLEAFPPWFANTDFGPLRFYHSTRFTDKTPKQ